MKFLVTIITGFILFASCKENKKNNEVIKQDVNEKKAIPI